MQDLLCLVLAFRSTGFCFYRLNAVNFVRLILSFYAQMNHTCLINLLPPPFSFEFMLETEIILRK